MRRHAQGRNRQAECELQAVQGTRPCLRCHDASGARHTLCEGRTSALSARRRSHVRHAICACCESKAPMRRTPPRGTAGQVPGWSRRHEARRRERLREAASPLAAARLASKHEGSTLSRRPVGRPAMRESNKERSVRTKKSADAPSPQQRGTVPPKLAPKRGGLCPVCTGPARRKARRPAATLRCGRATADNL